MKSLLIGAVAACALFGTAEAESWMMISTVDDGVLGFDQKSVRRTGDVATAWLINVYQRPATLPLVGTFDYNMHRVAMKCTDRTYRLISMVYYDIDGRVVYSHGNPNNEDRTTPPGSLMSHAMDFICDGETSDFVFDTTPKAVSGARALLYREAAAAAE